MRKSVATSVAILIGAALAEAASASPSSAQIIGLLNAERAANGLPADVTENPAWSRGCELHNRYTALHGLTHYQDPNLAEASAAGAEAGRNSVLSSGDSWLQGNPWTSAPLHYAQVMSPALAVTGAAESSGTQNCLWTWPGYTRVFVQPQGWVVPGPGRVDVPPSEVARELPFVPGDFVGLPQGTETGPHLYWFAAGPEATGDQLARSWRWNVRLVDAQLVGPDGPVPLRSVDRTTAEIGGYLPSGAISIPVRALRGNGAYSARATLANLAGETISIATEFRTRPRVNSVEVQIVNRAVDRLTVRVTTPAPVATLIVEDAGRTFTASARPGSDVAFAGLTRKPMRVCARSGGGESEYALAEGCREAPAVLARANVSVTRRGALARIRAPRSHVGARAWVRFIGLRRALPVRLRAVTPVRVPRGTRRVCVELPARSWRGVRYAAHEVCTRR